MRDLCPPGVVASLRWLKPVGQFLLLAAVLLTVNRILLAWHFVPPGARAWPQLFVTGWRFDALMLAYLLAPAWILWSLAPQRAGRTADSILSGYLALVLAGMIFLELATWPSLREFGSRPEAQFLEYLRHPREVLAMVWSGFRGELALVTLGVVMGAALGWRWIRPVVAPCRPRLMPRLGILLAGAAVLFIAARSSFGHRAANLSNAAFSQDRLLNEIGVNATYTLAYATYRQTHEEKNEGEYGRMDPTRAAAIVQRVRAELGGRVVGQREESIQRPPNIVVFLLESFGAEYTGRLGGTQLTPHYDRLAAEGLAFDHLFSTGTRTARGIEAVVTGFFPTPSRSVLKLNLAQRDFYTVPAMLQQAGYRTHFFYGGESNFDEMKSFLVNNGVQYVWDQPAIQRPGQAIGVWGIHDEDLFTVVDETLRQEQAQPFFALVLSTSNHTPFDYPRGQVAPDPQFAEATAENAIKYTDYALGQFFVRARRAPYFENTIFLIVADHGTRVSGDQLVPIHKFHVPACMVGPARLVPRQSIAMLASQVDLMPTLLGLTGRDWPHPMQGVDLLAVPEDERSDALRGRALLQYETHFGYWRDDQIVVLRPNLPPAQFTVEDRDGRGASGPLGLTSSSLDPVLAEEALAHSTLPRWLYRERLYQLPRPGKVASASSWAAPAGSPERR